MSLEHIAGQNPQGCPAANREILSRIGEKWSLEVVGMLCHGSRRFNELKRGIPGISQRMLTLTLRGLERDGLVRRTVLPTRPPRVDYELSPMGLTLIEPVHGLMTWVMANQQGIEEARQQFDTGEAAEPARRSTS